jgi:hypothetical protein
VSELSKDDGVAEVKVGPGRVDAKLDPKGTVQGQLLLQIVPGDDVGGSGQQARERGGGHRIRDATSADTRPWL